MAKEVPTAAAGVLLDRYRVQTELGRGGMGVVYACMDESLGRRVAVKTLSVGLLGRDREARMKRFQREVKALSQLDHPGILHIYDAGEADDPVVGWVLYYAMELIEGETLSERLIRSGPLDCGAAAAVVAKCAEALGSAHERGIVHRDVKPANIFLSARGRVVVADFGVCKIEGGSEITRKDQMVGTPSYLAPEQILGLPVDAKTDVFALGALLYVLATNSALRPQLDRAGLSRLAATDDAAQRALAVKNVPKGLPEVMAKALAQLPANRFPDGTAMAEALEPFATRAPEPYGSGNASSPALKVPIPGLGSLTQSGAFSDLPPPTLTSGPVDAPAEDDPSTTPITDSITGPESSPPDLNEPTSVDDGDGGPSEEVLPALEGDGEVRAALAPSDPDTSPFPPLDLEERTGVDGEDDPNAAPPTVSSISKRVVLARPAAPPVDAQETTVPVPLPPPRVVPPVRTRWRYAAMGGGAGLLGVVAVVALRGLLAAPPAPVLPHPAPLVTPEVVVEVTPPACMPNPGAAPVSKAELEELLERAKGLEKKEPQKALALWEKAASQAPTDWRPHQGLATALKRSGQSKAAEVHEECVRLLKPEEPATPPKGKATGKAP